MAANQRNQVEPNKSQADQDHKIDRNAPAGSKNSLGEESIRDGRPSTDDSIVEAIDELGPDTTAAADGKTK